MTENAPRRFLGSLAIVILTVAFLLVFALAIASVLYLTDGDRLGGDIAAESTSEPSDPAGPGSASSRLVLNDAGLGSLACGRSISTDGDAAPFVVSLSEVAASDDSLAVEVVLTDTGGGQTVRVVLFGVVTSAASTINEAVPDSFDSDLTACDVTAIQRGDRVLITGV